MPIHDRLPTELMMHIFSQVRPTKLLDIQLMHVCSAWRAILQITPDFWSDLLGIPGATKDEGFLQTLLQRSSPRTFGLNFVWRGGSTNWDKLLPSALFGPANTHRITYLIVPSLASLFSYYTEGRTSLLQKFKRENFGSLESLTVIDNDYTYPQLNDPEGYPQLADEDLPCLRRLRVPHTYLTPALILSTLTHIDITPWDRHYSRRIPSTTLLLSVFQRCTALQSFSIDHCIPEDIVHMSAETLLLPSLRCLQVVDPLVALVAGFLNSVSIPANAKVETASLFTYRHKEYTFSDMISHGRRKAMLEAVSQLGFEVLPDRWCLRAFAPNGQHLLHAIVQPYKHSYAMNEPHTSRLLSDLARSFARPKITITSFAFNCRIAFPLRPETLRKVLLALPHLTSFTLDGWSMAAQGGKLYWLLLRALHRFAANGTTTTACPRLEALTLVCAQDVPPAKELGDRIATLVESRVGLVVVGSKARRPPGLKSFTLRGRIEADDRPKADEDLRKTLQQRLDGLVEHVHVDFGSSR